MFYKVIPNIKVAQFFETRCIRSSHYKFMCL